VRINIRKILVFIGMFFISLLILQVKSYAGNFSVSCSPSGTVEPNSKVTISITGNNATGRVKLTGSNITLDTSSVWIEDNTKTVTGTVRSKWRNGKNYSDYSRCFGFNNRRANGWNKVYFNYDKEKARASKK